jgi:NIPSNAP
MKQLVEIRSLTLHPGKRGEFHRRYLEKALPLLKKWQMDVVAFGPSPHDENSYYIIRAFESLGHRQKSEDAYYGSSDWREGPREEMLELIESYIDIVIELERNTVDALRRISRPNNLA